MKHLRLITGLLLIILIASVSISLNVQASSERTIAQNQVIPEFSRATSGWLQVNNNGFGDQQAGEVSALEPFNNYLYAGTHNPINDARIFRSADGVTWTPVIDSGFGSDHDTAPRAILDMVVFKGYLYASTGRGNASQIWRTQDGLNWGQVVNAGFGNPDIVDLTNLVVFDLGYDQALYMGATNQVTGAEIWRSFSGDSNDWTKVAPTVTGTAVSHITSFALFDGALYATVAFEEATPAQIWRSYGGAWETIMSDGFGDSNTTKIGGTAVFNGYLYVGASNSADGAQLWRSNNGTNWTKITNAGFSNTNNQKIEAVFVFNNHLYVSTQNNITGIELWQSADGIAWEQINQNGFGDSNNVRTNWNNATAEFQNHLYLGTLNNTDGGELWQWTPAISPIYALDLSPNDTWSALPSSTVTYTLILSNTGNITDTYNLSITGNSWPTQLSQTSITVTADTNATFTATVTIPAEIGSSTTDVTTVSATSQGNNNISDHTQLITHCIIPETKVYLPMIIHK